jgi:membrane associated rhomboid family serine protease
LAKAVEISAALVGMLFLVFAAECLYPGLAGWGIRSRTGPGLLGILFSPLLHANAAHLLANAPALLILLILLFWDRHYQPWRTLFAIWLASGLGTWLIGRGGATHIGASSIIYGLAAYMIACGLVMGSWRGWLVGVLVFLAYGGIFYGVLPHPGPVSWEGHLCGAAAGVWAAKHHHV